MFAGRRGKVVEEAGYLPDQSPPSTSRFTFQSCFSALSCKYYSTFPPFEFPFSSSSHLFLFLFTLLDCVSLYASHSSFQSCFLTFSPLMALHSPIPLLCFHNAFSLAAIHHLLKANGVQQKAPSLLFSMLAIVQTCFCIWSAIKLGDI